MSEKKPPVNQLRQSWLRWLAIIAICAALISAVYVNFGIRAVAEARNKTLGLVVDYYELGRLAEGSPDTDFRDILTMVQEAGATGIVVRERILAEWEIAGDIVVYSGGQLDYILRNQYGTPGGAPGSSIEIVPTKTYILTQDPLVFDQLYSILRAKERYPEAFILQGYMGIACQLHSSERATMGMGYPLAQLQEAADMGFYIIPRPRGWEPFTEESVREVFRWIAKIPNIAAIGFNDQALPGGGDDEERQDILAEAMEKLGVPFIYFEFYNQTGIPGLAQRLDNQVLRAHAIGEGELQRYSEFQVALDRYRLAAAERGMRIIYLRFQGLINPGYSLEDNMELLAFVHDGLVSEGFAIGSPKPIESYKTGKIPMFLLGAGVVAATGWLVSLAAEPYVKKKWYRPYGILMVLGCIAWAGLMIIAPTLSRKLMSLVAAVVFPSLSVLLILLHEKNAGAPELARRKRIIISIRQLYEMSALTFIGSMIMSALLADPRFMLRLDTFVGVKAAHAIPLIIVPVILWLREENWFGIIEGTAKSSVRFWHIIVGGALIGCFLVYITRTGNDSLVAASELEIKIRLLLDKILGVRPRTKEFMIGHPLMLVLIYFGYRLNLFPVLMIGLIGQVSIMNTYAHIHTPVTISLLRTVHGLWVGMIVGVVAIIVLEWLIPRILKFINKHSGSLPQPGESGT